MNVYERLSTGVLRPPNLSARTPTLSESGGRGLMYPRCAMDLPQTKVSYELLSNSPIKVPLSNMEIFSLPVQYT